MVLVECTTPLAHLRGRLQFTLRLLGRGSIKYNCGVTRGGVWVKCNVTRAMLPKKASQVTFSDITHNKKKKKLTSSEQVGTDSLNLLSLESPVLSSRRVPNESESTCLRIVLSLGFFQFYTSVNKSIDPFEPGTGVSILQISLSRSQQACAEIMSQRDFQDTHADVLPRTQSRDS